jgi:hypothetical protein
MRMLRATPVVLAAALLSACVALQLGGPNAPDPATAAKLDEAVPTYEEAQLANKNDYIRVGEIDTFLCSPEVIGTTTDAQVITALRQKAQAMGANGLTDISCGHGPTDDLRGCSASIACSATALKIVSPDQAAN